MFGKDLKAANERAAALASLLALTGFALDEGAELPTADAFQAHLDTSRDAAVKAAIDPLKTQLATAQAAGESAQRTASAYADGLRAAGVKVADFAPEAFAAVEGAPLNAAAVAVKAAVELRVTQQSAKQVAAAGHPHAVEVPANGSDTAGTDATATPETAADFMAVHKELRAKDPHAAAAYFRAHAHRFPVS